MSYKCIGCDGLIPWDGKGLFCYTCPCGSTIFYNEDTEVMNFPASFIIGLSIGRLTPHLGDLVGESAYTSPLKERLIAELREKGFTWMEECEQCQQDGTLARKLERERHFAVREAHRILGFPEG